MNTAYRTYEITSSGLTLALQGSQKEKKKREIRAEKIF